MTVQLSTNCIITSNMDDLFKQNPSRVSLHFQFLFSLYAILGQDVNLMYLLDLSTKGDGNCRSESLVKNILRCKKVYRLHCHHWIDMFQSCYVV